MHNNHQRSTICVDILQLISCEIQVLNSQSRTSEVTSDNKALLHSGVEYIIIIIELANCSLYSFFLISIAIRYKDLEGFFDKSFSISNQ